MTARYHNDELPSEELSVCYATSEPDDGVCGSGGSRGSDSHGFSQVILEDYSPSTRQNQSDSQDQVILQLL